MGGAWGPGNATWPPSPNPVCKVTEMSATPQVLNLARIREALRLQLPLLSIKYQVESLGVFGSYVRQEQQAGSDLDVLVSFRDPPSLLEFIELENYLSDLLGLKVDLVMKDALKPRIGAQILREVVPV